MRCYFHLNARGFFVPDDLVFFFFRFFSLSLVSFTKQPLFLSIYCIYYHCLIIRQKQSSSKIQQQQSIFTSSNSSFGFLIRISGFLLAICNVCSVGSVVVLLLLFMLILPFRFLQYVF